MTEHADVREFLRKLADEIPLSPIEPRPAVRRAKRRLVRTLTATTLTVAALAAGTVVGFGRLAGAPSLPANPQPSPRPAYHHNGDIAVRANMADAIFQIVDPDSGREVPLPLPGAGTLGWDVAWSPDGATLAYWTKGALRALDVGSGQSRRITVCDQGCSGAWSPDGNAIAVAHDDQLDLVRPDGTNTTTVTTFGSGISGPTWSPDGRQIAFVASPAPGVARRLYVIDRDGSGLRLLAQNPAPSDKGGIWSPAWSPDGSRIAFLEPTQCSKRECLQDVAVIDPDGANQTTVLQAGRCFCIGFTPGLTWSPDGTKMALVIPGPDGEPWGLYVMNADGSGLRLLRAGAWGRPAWRPVP